MAHEKNKELLDALNNCAAECNHCATACLDEQDVNMLARCIKLNIDCADICQLTTSYVTRSSEHAHHLLKECAEICEACAEECEKHSHLEHCRVCAEACRRCAEECMQTAA
jgi:adenine-specific DNA methylase